MPTVSPKENDSLIIFGIPDRFTRQDAHEIAEALGYQNMVIEVCGGDGVIRWQSSGFLYFVRVRQPYVNGPIPYCEFQPRQRMRYSTARRIADRYFALPKEQPKGLKVSGCNF